MNRSLAFLLTVAALATCVPQPSAQAQTVQITPFVGYQSGGSFFSIPTGQKISLGSAMDYGGTVDIAVNKSWRVELLYSKQDAKIQDNALGVGVDLAVERYMIGLQEEKGAEQQEKVRYFGTFLIGATRFVPDLPGFDSVSKFGLGLSLGVKTFPAKNVGLRFEARGFYTAVETDGGAICASGQCLFSFSSSGFWQGDVSAGLILAF